MDTPNRSGMPRRTFVKTTAGVLAVAAASGGARSQSGDRVRVGVAGTGSRGRDLMRKLASVDEAQIAAICDDFPPHLKLGVETAPDAAPHDRYETMIDEAKLDAVIIATPLHLHYPMCVAAIDRGIPVFCEKTMCHTIDEARRLADRVAAKDAIFQVGLQRRANAVYDQALAMIQTGMLGTVTTIKCQWHRNDSWRRPLPVEPDHPQFEALEHRLNWRLYWDFSQGLMSELGSHQVDVANRLLGTAPKCVSAMGGVDYWKDGRDVYDNVFCNYEYDVPDAGEGKPQTVRVTFSAIQTNAHEGVSELAMGTKGSLMLSQKLGLFYTENSAASPTPDGIDGVSGATLVVPDSPWAHRGKPMEFTNTDDDTRTELYAFVQAVLAGNRKTACDVRIGLENTATSLIANEAIRSGGVVGFPEDCRLTG